MFTRTPNHVNVIRKWALNYVANRLKDGISLPKQYNPSPDCKQTTFDQLISHWINGYEEIRMALTLRYAREKQCGRLGLYNNPNTQCAVCELEQWMCVMCIISPSVINHKSQTNMDLLNECELWHSSLCLIWVFGFVFFLHF